MNSFYGVLGTPGCRFAASALAGAITSLGQHILYWTRDLVSARGLEVIYGDTDPLFVRMNAPEPGAAQQLPQLGAELARFVNESLARHVREDYGVESRLETEFRSDLPEVFSRPCAVRRLVTRVKRKVRTGGQKGMRDSAPRWTEIFSSSAYGFAALSPVACFSKVQWHGRPTIPRPVLRSPVPSVSVNCAFTS